MSPVENPLNARGMIELDAESIAAVAGGINPQPLPPEQRDAS